MRGNHDLTVQSTVNWNGFPILEEKSKGTSCMVWP